MSFEVKLSGLLETEQNYRRWVIFAFFSNARNAFFTDKSICFEITSQSSS